MIRFGKIGKLFSYVFLSIYALIILVPFTMMVLNSFKTMRELFLKPFSLPSKFSPDNFTKAWKFANIGVGYRNSLFVAGVTVLIVATLASMFAYMVSKYEFNFRRTIFLYSMLGLALPARLAVIPIFILLRNMGLTNSLLGLILVYSSVNLPFSIFILKNFIDAVPNELCEAARIDGANVGYIYYRVILPLIKPALSIIAIVTFVNVWNDFFFPLILINDRSKATITLAVSIFFGEYSIQWPLLFAGLTLSIAPTVIMFLIFSRFFIAGMTQGAIK
ncbi:carbohydrate ABC transporter permease [Pseudothermotoga sp.]|nr:carbohydrate ABC transporter permease [Pseudothermotoga sp.]MCX7812813.1 carbohydrate ABC transporter permease [Pseudothermotoga sp.]MDW8139093.1 carbohydrate ABC transporter permease [Pseudothermotoga sp.]